MGINPVLAEGYLNTPKIDRRGGEDQRRRKGRKTSARRGIGVRRLASNTSQEPD